LYEKNKRANLEKKGIKMFGKKLHIRKLERWMMAVTFAEAGDHQTALELLTEKDSMECRNKKKRRIQRRPDQRPSLRA
jgi:hypothetical protein